MKVKFIEVENLTTARCETKLNKLKMKGSFAFLMMICYFLMLPHARYEKLIKEFQFKLISMFFYVN
jgi:hypothetical protein